MIFFFFKIYFIRYVSEWQKNIESEEETKNERKVAADVLPSFSELTKGQGQTIQEQLFKRR